MANPLDNLKPWKPGQSGNPSGRPKALFSQATRRIGAAKVTDFPHFVAKAEELGLDPNGMTVAELQAHAAILNGLGNGGASHLGISLDRMEGKVADRLEVAGSADQPAVRFEFVEAQSPSPDPPEEGDPE